MIKAVLQLTSQKPLEVTTGKYYTEIYNAVIKPRKQYYSMFHSKYQSYCHFSEKSFFKASKQQSTAGNW